MPKTKFDFECQCDRLTGHDVKAKSELVDLVNAIERELQHREEMSAFNDNREPNVISLYITSGVRCIPHNAECGGVENSYHCQGMAVDLDASEYGLGPLAEIAELCGAGGIGIYHDNLFVHVDIGPAGRRWEE